MIEIRAGGIVLLDGEEIGRLELQRPYLEPELVGFWLREDSPEMDGYLWDVCNG